jgi:hypothetical protein
MTSATFTILGDPALLMAKLSTNDRDGRLCFGLLASTSDTVDVLELSQRIVLFHETVLEALVKYGLTVEKRQDSVALSVHLQGSSRDHEIPSWIRFTLKRLGCDVEESAQC